MVKLTYLFHFHTNIWPFLWYQTTAVKAASPPPPPKINAFQLLLYNQRQIDQQKLPSKLTVRTKKDQLFNYIIDMLQERGLQFSSGEVAFTGQNLVKSLTDTLWYVDGHHESLKKQCCPIPEFFSRFTGYNTPELSKHRKRSVQNLSSSSLQAMSTSLFRTLQASYWKRPLWQGFHSEVESLVRSIADYTEYLFCSKQNNEDSACT